MQFNLHHKLGARFKLVVHKGDGIPVKETEWFHNLVLDTGLARMSAGTWIDRCCVGTGNSTPVVSQVALDNFVASTTTIQASSTGVQVTTEPYYRYARVTWRFGEGVAAGNISEVGLGWGNANLWNRALIKDAGGNPTTITILSDEYLDVVSEVRDYPASSASGSFNLLSKTGTIISSHTYTARPFISTTRVVFGRLNTAGQCRFYDGVKGSSVSGYPSGNFLGFLSGYTASNPTPTSLSLTASLALAELNATHKSIMISDVNGLLGDTSNGGLGYVFEINPTITKTNTQTMTYSFTMSWGRYTP